MTQRMIKTNHKEDWLRLAARCADRFDGEAEAKPALTFMQENSKH